MSILSWRQSQKQPMDLMKCQYCNSNSCPAPDDLTRWMLKSKFEENELVNENFTFSSMWVHHKNKYMSFEKWDNPIIWQRGDTYLILQPLLTQESTLKERFLRYQYQRVPLSSTPPKRTYAVDLANLMMVLYKRYWH